MKAHILLLEDDQLHHQQFEEILQDDGYEVHHAINGGQALKIIQDKTIPLSLAILDLKIDLPGDLEKDHLGEASDMKRGIAVARKLIEIRGPLPIIFASAFGNLARDIVEAGGFTSPHVFYKKETIYRDAEVINNSIQLALEGVEAAENELDSETVFNHRIPGTLTVRINHTRALGDGNANIFRVVKRSEIAFILRDRVRGIGIHLLDGKTIHYLGELGPKLFDEQYLGMIQATGEEDFLIRGESQRMALWVNKDTIYGYDNNNIFFTNGEHIIVGASIRMALKTLFPAFKTR